MMKALFRTAKKSVPEEQLPALHQFVDVTVASRAARSVSVEEIGPKEIVVGDAVGRSGERAVFVYQNAMGRFRFATTISAVKDGMTRFETPKQVDALGGAAQKRSDVRMDTLVMGAWRPAPGGKGAGEFNKASIRDISRGGCALIIDRQCKVGQYLEVNMQLRSDTPALIVIGEVMRTEQVPTSGKFSHGLRFVGLTAGEDRTILDFINRRQAELRSRGLA